jgi:hypothetical protein
LIQFWQGANPGWTSPNLPPGQLRRLQQGKSLPPGIARQALPPGLLANLPAYPGHAYYAVGPDVVLIAAATGAVVSLLSGVLAQQVICTGPLACANPINHEWITQELNKVGLPVAGRECP